MNAQYWIDKLDLEPHIEGGYFKQTFVSSEYINLEDGRIREASSNILFLLTASNPCHLPRLKSEETWFYHYGHSLSIHMIYPDGHYECAKIGNGENELLSYTVKRNVIFGSSIDSDCDNDYSIVSCVVSPAFHYEDFEVFTQDELIKQYPHHRNIIKKMAYKKT